MSDDVNRPLRAARPRTSADYGWAASAEGDRALGAIRRRAAATATGSRLRMHMLLPAPERRARAIAYGITGAAVVTAVALSFSDPGPTDPNPPGTPIGAPAANFGPRPQNLALVAYTDCSAALSGLRAQAAAHVNAYGLADPRSPFGVGTMTRSPAAATLDLNASAAAAAPAASTPEHSVTNVQEAGVDEPDLVKTDGNRIVSVSGGVLRVVDARTREATGTLDLSAYAGADGAQLMMSGNRVLVVLAESTTYYRGRSMPARIDAPYPTSQPGSTYLLVDIADKPKIVSMLHPKAGYVDARLVGGTVRLVVQSAPRIAFPQPATSQSGERRVAQDRDAIKRAPLSAWLPSYDVTSGGVTTSHSVTCDHLSHPASYTGTSMLTVYSIDLAGDLNDVAPVSLAADGSTVYATASSLYVSSNASHRTQIHRFDISRPGRPTYLGSGAVPGGLLDAYSMSDYAGSLRVVTTKSAYRTSSATSVFAMNADTLKITGHVDGLGRGEQVHAVRFLGPLAYVVTFKSVDPLYVIDLHDPTKPRAAGELKVTGYSDYLHPTSTGRLLGVGQDVKSGRVAGLQVSLFDVSDPSGPARIDNVVRPQTQGGSGVDPHAFLYWPKTGTAVVPIQSWNQGPQGTVLVLHVGTDNLRTIGTIRNPGSGDFAGNIERTFVVNGSIWTMSQTGLLVSDLTTLHRQAWVNFA
jgi:uncharacterized secreted protein with C-terminal beta-propeller domain